MLHRVILFILLLATIFTQAQNANETGATILPAETVDGFFTDSLKKYYGIDHPIWRVYTYDDSEGRHYLVLSESDDRKTVTGSDTLHRNIHALELLQQKEGWLKKWEIRDQTIDPTARSNGEQSIWFWTRYSQFKEVDQTGTVYPILVYGTTGLNQTEDGRIRILIYYKQQKIFIRHQNGVHDHERNTKVDKAFYSLPISIQASVKKLMHSMVDNKHAIFPYGREKAI
jgi:hypothetical protein